MSLPGALDGVAAAPRSDSVTSRHIVAGAAQPVLPYSQADERERIEEFSTILVVTRQFNLLVVPPPP